MYIVTKRIRQENASRYHLLLQFPQAGRNRDAVQAGLRSFPVGNYMIFYREIREGPRKDRYYRIQNGF